MRLKVHEPKAFRPVFITNHLQRKNHASASALDTDVMLYNRAERGARVLLYRIRCSRRRRRCHTDPRCRWISPGSWWRCFPRRSSSAKGLAGTTSDAWASPAWGQSSWCPRPARLGRTNITMIWTSWLNESR